MSFPDIIDDFKQVFHSVNHISLSKFLLMPVTIDNEDIEQVNHYKYLGTEIDANLSWKVNTNAIKFVKRSKNDYYSGSSSLFPFICCS